MKTQRQGGPWALFASGFRPFFIAAAGLSSLAIVIWVWLFLGKAPLVTLSHYPPLVWHMHEMVYGYVGAVIAGFLLTAVHNWTGRITLRGWPLALLLFIWLGARCLPFLGAGFAWPIALFNVLFFIYLGVAIAIPIIRAGNNRNLFVVAILTVLAITNATLHATLLGLVEGAMIVATAIAIAFYLQLLLTIVIAGRVFPMFSANGLNGIYTPKRQQWLEVACVVSFLVFAVVNISVISGYSISKPIILLVALLVVVLHSLRIGAWFHWRIWTKPLIWILHAGYYFLIIGVLLMGLSAYYPETRVAGLHAMLAGGVGLITMGMMARVSLGHTGRDIHQPNKWISIAFVLVTIAAFVRVFLPLISGQTYLLAITLSSALWGLGFGLFLVLYVPLLLTRRIDGAEG